MHVPRVVPLPVVLESSNPESVGICEWTSWLYLNSIQVEDSVSVRFGSRVTQNRSCDSQVKHTVPNLSNQINCVLSPGRVLPCMGFRESLISHEENLKNRKAKIDDSAV